MDRFSWLLRLGHKTPTTPGRAMNGTLIEATVPSSNVPAPVPITYYLPKNYDAEPKPAPRALGSLVDKMADFFMTLTGPRLSIRTRNEHGSYRRASCRIAQGGRVFPIDRPSSSTRRDDQR